MKALICSEFGPASSLSLKMLGADEPLGPTQVRVRVNAAALNFFDTLIIQGKYQFKPDLPFSPAGELAGEVEALGSEVTNLSVGDRVMAYTKWGAARQQVTLPAEQCFKLPAAVDDNHAAGVMITYGTAIHGLRNRAQVKAGETVAVLGASGGAGLAAVEIAKAMGAKVIACASSAEKLEIAREHGADELINYAEQDLKAELKSVDGGSGVDVVYDVVGGDYAEQALRALKWKGRYLVVGFAAGDIPRLPANLMLLKGCDVRGVFWGRAIEEEPEAFNEDTEQLLAWLEAGVLKPRIHGVYSLEDYEQAFEEISSRRARGKVILRP
ncbi:NADPH:quinone oxidoreductase family protein [Rhodobacteraceae bacterium RKSG542]|uniref:NADPH:quinone oxidoreductase family protein n=1 Tax=Pseudovibrio flavus TaxID=2529854 RepID=UPI0012BB65EE|nr:NADPH:quinone oxidoreductase family protein [Pseudovibrio flavus]MTI18340.1 NADPH:quinone oxidoreductase family protein [Pseudovibrio flavus]